MTGFKEVRSRWQRRIKILIISLIISGVLNSLFLGVFIYSAIKDKQFYAVFSSKRPIKFPSAKKEMNNPQYLAYFSSFSFRDLLPYLFNTELVEEGYTKRDLALACLVSFHNFNIEKALPGQTLQKRVISFSRKGKQKEIDLFANVSNEQYTAIIDFSKLEKWPFTNKGLFVLLQRWQKPKEQSLKQAFTLSSEFQAIKTLFNQVSPNIEEDVLIDILCDGSWDIIEKFYQEQSLQADLSEDRRRVFLLDFLTRKSTASARLFLQIDYNYVVKRFDDNHILQMLELIDDKNEHLEKFCEELLKSPRSNLVLKKSSDRLYRLNNEEPPVAFDHNKALEHFGLITKIQPIVIKETSKAPQVKKEDIKTRKHIVQDGENLWKIARKYKVDVQELIKINNLENNKIHPGTEIVLP